MLPAFPEREYREARERETTERNESFVRQSETLCGFRVMPLTVERFATLDAIGSPFVCGGRIEPVDIAEFLWIARGQTGGRFRGLKQWLFARKVRSLKLTFGQIIDQCSEWIQRATQDIPGGSGKGEELSSPASWVAIVVDRIASEYGWSEREVMSLPLSRAFQYLRCIITRKDPKAALLSESDRIVSDWLRDRNEARRKEAECASN